MTSKSGHETIVAKRNFNFGPKEMDGMSKEGGGKKMVQKMNRIKETANQQNNTT
jgi:hypothetical protein